MKKQLLALGALAAVATPAIAVVSCGGTKSLKAIETHKTPLTHIDPQKYGAIDWSEIKYSNVDPYWQFFPDGVGKIIGQHAVSYLVNMAKHLGWQPDPLQPIQVLPDSVMPAQAIDGFTGINTDENAAEVSLENNFMDSLLLKTSMVTAHKSFSHVDSALNNDFWNGISAGWTVQPFNKAVDSFKTSIIVGTQKHLSISGLDLTNADAVKGKVIEFFKSNPWGTTAKAEAKSITFDIKHDSIDFWLMKDYSKDEKVIQHINHVESQKFVNKLNDLKNSVARSTLNKMLNERWSDFEVTGTSTSNFKIASVITSGSDFIGVDEQSEPRESTPYGSFFNSIKENYFVPDDGHMSYIDGDKPGTVVSKIWVKQGREKIGSEEIRSADNFAPKFKILEEDSDEYNNMLTLVFTTILNLNKGIGNEEIPMGNKDFISALHFLSSQTFSEEKIKVAFKALNNGSHDMKLLEWAMRGIENVPKEEMPQGRYYSNASNIIGFANIASKNDMIWIAYSQENEHAYILPGSPYVQPTN